MYEKGVEYRYVLLILVVYLQLFEENDEIYRQLLSKKDSPDSKSVNSTTNETVKDEHKNCYEEIDGLHDIREAVWFWLEGVFLFITGIIGLIMNILAIIILKHCPDNSSFSVLMI